MSYKIIVEKIVGSQSSASNMHGVIDDNSNRYRNIVTNVMGINHGCASECSTIDEEPNADTIRFLDLLKDFEEPL